MLTLGQQQVHFEFTQRNYLLVTFVRMVLSIVKGEFWYQMVIVSRFSVVTNIRIRIRIRIFSPESQIFGFGFVIFLKTNNIRIRIRIRIRNRI